MKRKPSISETLRLRDALISALEPSLVSTLNGQCIHLATKGVPGLGTFVVYAERDHDSVSVRHVITVTFTGRVGLSRPDSTFVAALCLGPNADTQPPCGAMGEFRTRRYGDVASIEFTSASTLPEVAQRLAVNSQLKLGVLIKRKGEKPSRFPPRPTAATRSLLAAAA